jgi:glycosyltransferase involved in cell wall biosynthesis
VIIRCRNEYPVVLGTIHAIQEEMEWWGVPWEIVVVDNLSDDNTSDVLEDKYRRWIRKGLLKVVRYNYKASTWCAINRGYEASDGDMIVICDAHISVSCGSINWLVNGAMRNGGIWHAPLQIWGDTEGIRRYGHDLKLVEKFWGDPCPHMPPGEDGSRPWKIPMAGACLMAIQRREIEEFGLYHEEFKAYGGGEPYLAMKWWMKGSSVWMEPRALCRHAFGFHAQWETAKKDKRARNSVYKKGGELSRDLKKGDEYVNYRAGYTVSNDEHYFNFLLAAHLLGGPAWVMEVGPNFAKKIGEKKALEISQKVSEAASSEDASGYKHMLDDLLKDPPWKECGKHKMKLPSWLAKESAV